MDPSFLKSYVDLHAMPPHPVTSLKRPADSSPSHSPRIKNKRFAHIQETNGAMHLFQAHVNQINPNHST